MFNKTGLTQQEVKTLHGVVTALTEKKSKNRK
jgi:tRNA C32,U32 (ribose-2'-O)-methylase TrmJ